MFRSPKEIAKSPTSTEEPRRPFRVPFVRGLAAFAIGCCALGWLPQVYRGVTRSSPALAKLMAPIEDRVVILFRGRRAPKIITPEMLQTIQTAPLKGRRVRAIKIYRKLAARVAQAQTQGHEVGEAEKKLADAAALIQKGEYDLAEQLMSRIDFFVPAWLVEPDKGEPEAAKDEDPK